MASITDAQVKELRRQLQTGSSVQRASLKTGMDRKSAAKYREGKMPRERRAARDWRTRLDPLAVVWAEVQAELERAPGLQAVKYESQEGVGRIVFVRPSHPHLKIDIKLTTPVQLRRIVAVRKLLQMTSKELALLCDANVIFGLGSVLPSYDLSTEDVFTVHFVKQFAWTLLHGAYPLMHVRYGEPSIRVAGFPEDEFLRGVRRVFPGLGDEAVNRLRTIALTVSGQPHGCMLVITGDAKGEAERLKAQCTVVEPFPLTDSFIPMLTAIDGSILVDTEGICHAVGVILDGKASEKCSSERGSRYNSAVRYVCEGSNRIAVVKSEDGAISLLPESPPAETTIAT